MKNMKRKIIGIVVCMLLIATALPAIGIIHTPIDEKTTAPFVHLNTARENMIPSFFQGDCIVWDNMGYGPTAYHAQDDPPETTVQWDSFEADDFQFEEETEVHWVYWVMCYWNCNAAQGPKDYHYDWNITFYEDDGSGCCPGSVYAGPFTIADADIFKGQEIWNLTNVANGIWVDTMGVILPEPVTFLPGAKYWISLYSIGSHFPQSGWYVSNGTDGTPIKLHEALFKSTHWGYPAWTNFTMVDGQPLDMLFILGGKLLPFGVTIKKGLGITATIQNQLPETYNETNITVTFTITGGFVLNRTASFFIKQLNASATETLKFYPIGFGKITIEIKVIAQDGAPGFGNKSGFLILFFVI